MKSLRITLTITIALTLASCLLPFIANGQSPARTEAELIGVLKSSAPQKDKFDACRELAHLGTKEAVATLASLLGDEQLSHMARYGLETIPSPSVDQALRDALGALKGRQLAGVITSLGVRRDAKAVKPLSDLLESADPEVAVAAARALGDIATKDATQTLESALAGSSAANRLAIFEGLFRCAETFLKAGQKRDATRVYDRLRAETDAAHQVRAGALRGAIMARDEGGLKLLTEAISGSDWILADAAARTAMELRMAAVTKVLTQALKSAAPDRQVLILQTLGKRADAKALPAVLEATRSGDKNVRLVAIHTVSEIGDASASASLAGLVTDSDRELAEAARASLASLPGKKADDAVLALMRSTDPATKLAGLDLVARRRMVAALPALRQATADAEPTVRAQALRQLAELGGEAELPGLLAQLEVASDAQSISAVQTALSTLCSRLAKPETGAERVIAKIPRAQPAQRAALVCVLGSTGGAKALATVRQAVDDAHPEVHAAAVSTLTDWPTPDAASELLALARSLASADEKLACLRSVLRWAADSDVPAKQRLALCTEATGLIQRDAERKLLLAALGSVNSPEAVAAIRPFVEISAVREEACVAVVNIAERMSRSRNNTKLAPGVITGLEQVAQATANGDLAKRAKALLDTNK